MNLKTTIKIALATLVAVPLAGWVWAAATTARHDEADRVTRGKYLVTYGDCNACHTPLKMGANGPEPDWSRMLAGHPTETELPPPPTWKGRRGLPPLRA